MSFPSSSGINISNPFAPVYWGKSFKIWSMSCAESLTGFVVSLLWVYLSDVESIYWSWHKFWRYHNRPGLHIFLRLQRQRASAMDGMQYIFCWESLYKPSPYRPGIFYNVCMLLMLSVLRTLTSYQSLRPSVLRPYRTVCILLPCTSLELLHLKSPSPCVWFRSLILVPCRRFLL